MSLGSGERARGGRTFRAEQEVFGDDGVLCRMSERYEQNGIVACGTRTQYTLFSCKPKDDQHIDSSG
jgi:hypothetical protein